MTSKLPISERLDKAMKQPKELMAFSIHHDKIAYDDSALRYYYFPDAEVDRQLNLGTGYGAYTPKPEPDKHIDIVLEGLLKYEAENGRVNAHIICWRGMLTQIMNIASDPRQEIHFHAQNFDGQIFLEHDHETSQASRTIGPDQAKFMYSGFNFEKFATLEKPWGETTREEIEGRYKGTYKHGSEYCTIVSAGVGNVRLAYGAEVDCVEGDRDPENALKHYVELKTTGTIHNQRQAANFERKLARSWAQSFLIGTPKIVYGFRDRDLNLRAVEEFQTDKIPSLVKNSPNLTPEQKWNGKDAIRFLAIFVSWLKDTVKDNETYSITHTPESGFIVLKPKELSFEKRLGFLPASFVQWRVQQMQAAPKS